MEFKERVKILAQKLREKNIDFAFILQNVDLFYFTGSICDGTLLISKNEDVLYFTRRGEERIKQESPWEVIKVKGFHDIKETIQNKKMLSSCIGLEFDVLPYKIFSHIQKLFPNSEFKDIGDDIRWQRRIKSAYELKMIRESALLCDEVMDIAKDIIKQGRREIDIAAEIEMKIRKQGNMPFHRMRGFSGEAIGQVVSGYSAGSPSTLLVPISGKGLYPVFPQGPSQKTIEENEPIIVDYVTTPNGYYADETRTFVLGKLSSKMKESLDFCIFIMKDMEKTAKIGIKAVDLYNRGWQWAKKYGFEENFMGVNHNPVPFIGHGVGLEIDEHPFIARGMDYSLEKGMVFAFEPKIVFKEGAVGIENTYVVKTEGVENLTKFEERLIEL
jgi:Xaa-Pro aminopeptidase